MDRNSTVYIKKQLLRIFKLRKQYVPIKTAIQPTISFLKICSDSVLFKCSTILDLYIRLGTKYV